MNGPQNWLARTKIFNVIEITSIPEYVRARRGETV